MMVYYLARTSNVHVPQPLSLVMTRAWQTQQQQKHVSQDSLFLVLESHFPAEFLVDSGAFNQSWSYTLQESMSP